LRPDGIDINLDVVMQPGKMKRESCAAEFDRAREEAFTNEGGPPVRERDTPPSGATERNFAREQDHPDAVRAGVRFSAWRSGYPNNQIRFD
jgi:hypothetical protein